MRLHATPRLARLLAARHAANRVIVSLHAIPVARLRHVSNAMLAEHVGIARCIAPQLIAPPGIVQHEACFMLG